MRQARLLGDRRHDRLEEGMLVGLVPSVGPSRFCKFCLQGLVVLQKLLELQNVLL